MPDESEIEISVWRKTDNRRVWYEWLVETFVTIPGSSTLDRRESSSSRTSTAATNSRVRLSCSKLHNANGKYSSMNL